MPSLPFKSSRKKKEADINRHDPQASPREAANVDSEVAPPPVYAAVASNGESSVHCPPSASRRGADTHHGDDDDEVDITAAFMNLKLDADSSPGTPDVDTCLAHLKLLFAIQAMKEDVGYTDGLWNIWDSRADRDVELSAADLEALGLTHGQKKLPEEDARKLKLSKIREKRWALFVARAVDRYEAWWAALQPQSMLREADMNEGASSLYGGFVTETRKWPWASHMLPPLDVLMVWHAHMLNPRAFLEDTLRCGLSSFWATGMPWNYVNAAISSDFAYTASEEAKAYWVANTNRDWANVEDSPSTKTIKCPACQTFLDVSWTSCGQDETSKNAQGPGLVGNGYGDGDFKWFCTGCGLQLTKKLLSAAKFTKDAQALTVNSLPMPGTILDPISGRPKSIVNDPRGFMYPRTFPNRLIKKKLIVQLADLIKPGAETPPDMETIRDLIQRVMTDGRAIREIEGQLLVSRSRLSVEARICVRKMMSRYWENFSPFALDLAGAVLRQGIFTAKMVQIDWLHSPACRETMARLTTKYERFMGLMATYTTQTCVPTLDIDLAWHTHQLSPSAYYAYTTSRTTKFTDHDDKIDEDKLAKSFEWTMKTYQEKYSEVYSECTCWYCETTRASNTSSVARILGSSNQDKAAQNFLASGRADLCPPDKSAHISSHNAVRFTPTTSIQSRVVRHQQARQQHQLEVEYEKACKRAKKKGRTLPPRDEYYNHWGYQYYMYSPFVYPLYFTPGLYYGWDPGFVGMSGGGWASCAAGSCGGGVASGACGGAGGCGSTGAGGFSCGGGGGGGGGCGGGGGGGGGCGGGGGGGGGGCGGGGC